MGRNRGFYRCLSISRPIHAIRKSTMRDWRSGGMSVPFGTFHHFDRQSRQQQAQACFALNTGCPRIGVCLPSFGGFARLSRSLFASLNPLGVAASPRVAAPARGGYGARRVRMKSSQWRRIVSMSLSAMYFLSASESLNRLRNLDFASRWNAASVAVITSPPSTRPSVWRSVSRVLSASSSTTSRRCPLMRKTPFLCRSGR